MVAAGVKCSSCGMMQMARPTCKSCGNPLGGPAPPFRTSPAQGRGWISGPAPVPSGPDKISYFDLSFWFSAKGRLNRWRFFLGSVMAGGVASIIMKLVVPTDALGVPTGGPGWILYVAIALLVSYVSTVLSIKRFHDLGKSGYFVLLFVIPLVNFILGLMLLFGQGDPGPNMYGPNPLHAS